MKTIFTNSYFNKTFKNLLAFCVVLLMSINAFAQVTATEDFENESTANNTTPHTFSESGINFLTDLTFQNFVTTFGYNNSTSYIQVNGNTVTKTITIQNASTSFKINSFAAYVASNSSGGTATNGIVTFVGTLVGGGTATATVNVASTGVVPGGQTREANLMVNGLSFAGTALDGVFMTSLSVSTSATVQYAQLDHISFTTQAVVTNQFSISDVTQNEGNSGTSNFTFTVTRSSNTAASSVQVQSSNGSATSGSDYTAFPLTTVNFTAGSALTQTVNVVVNGDVSVEPNETFTMTLSNPTGGVLLDATGTGTIVDDDAINEPFDDETHQTSTFSQSGNNFQTTGKLLVKNAGNFGQGGTSGYASSTEPYAVGNQGSLQITSPGKSFNIISADLWAAAVSGSSPNFIFTATNCTITFTGTKADGSGTVTHTAAITPSGTNVHSTVLFAGSPFDGVQLSAIAFSTPTGIQYLQIDNFKYGTATLTNTQLSIDDVSVVEGTGGGSTTATFTVTRTNNTTAFTVNLASSDGTATAGTDYTAYPSTTLTFTSGGALTQTVNVTVLKDATIEPNETFNMTLSGATNGTVYLKQTGIGTILNDDSVVETFEDETNNALTFSQNSVNFSASGGFKVKQASTFGSGSSTFYLTSSNNAVGNQGTFSITSPNKAFKLNFLDAWVGTSETAFSSGPVTFTGTLFGGGTVTATQTITATSATGAGWQQNISFVGTPLDNVLLTAIQVSTGGSLTLCEIDNFNYTVVNTLPIIEVVDASNVAITNGGAAATGNNTDFGGVCLSAGTVSKTYTIKNSGNSNLTLSGSPLADLGGADASHFSITTQPTSPIAAAGSVTFTVQFDPSSAGLKNATVTLSNNDATNSPYVINIIGTGNANPVATITANPNPICQNATLSLSAPAGATTYLWSGNGIVLANANSTTAVPTASGAQTYSLTATSSAGCTATATTSVTVNAAPSATITPTPSSVCVNGTINLSAPAGATTYLWSGNGIVMVNANSTTAVPTATGAQTYSVTVTGSGGCSASATTSVTVNSLPVPAPSSNTPVCTGNSLNLSSASSTTYFWSGPNSFTSTLQNPSISNVTIVAQGTYTVTQTTSFGCTASATTAVIINQTPTATAAGNTPLCVGQAINLSSTGSGTYLWSGPNSFTSTLQNPTIASAIAGNGGAYTVTVTSTGCTATAAITMVVNALPVPNPSSNSPLCSGNTLNLSSIAGMTTYSWTGPNSFSSSIQNPSITSATTAEGGSYTVTVTNSNGCSASATTSVTVNITPVSNPSSDSPKCAGTTLTFNSVAGMTTYAWMGPNSFSSSIQAPSISNVTTAANGTYTLTVTNGACSASATTGVVINALATAIATPSTQTICSAGPITTIAITGTASSYSWTRDNTTAVTGIAASGSGDISGSLTNTTDAPITVTFTITPVGTCNGTPITATVVVNPIPTATASTPSQTICSGASITGITFNNPAPSRPLLPDPSSDIVPTAPKETKGIVLNGPVAGTVFNWTRDNTATVTGIAASGSGNISGTLTNTTALPVTVTFTITPSYTNAGTTCTGTPITVTVLVNPNPASATITDTGISFCQGSSSTLSAPADPNYTYAWERSLTGIANPNSFTAFGGTTQTQVVTTSGVYRAIVTNQYNCSARDTTAVSFGDFSFNGSLGAGDAQQTGRMNRFAVASTCAAPTSYPGNFTTSGSRFYDSYTITNPRNVPVCATIGLKSGCGTTLFSAVYLGSFNPTSVSTNYLADHGSSFPLTAFYEATIPANGTIVVVVHEVNPGTGCADYKLTVELPREAVGITVTPNTSVCAGTPVTLTASTANTYLWNPGGATTQTINPTVNATTDYTVTLGYGNGTCSATATTQVAVINPNASSNSPVCVGNTLNLSSGSASSYSWTGPNSFTSSLQNPSVNNVTSLAGGVYSVVVVNGGCTATATTNVVINTLPVPNPSSDSPKCVGTTLTFNSNAGMTAYAWSGPNSFSSSIQAPLISSVTTAANGTYTLTITNSNGCSASATTGVVVNAIPAPPTLTLTSASSVCTPATLNLTASGCAGTVTWSQGAATGTSLTLSAVGTYSITATCTVNGCISDASSAVSGLEIKQTPAAPTITPPAQLVVCSPSTLTLTASGCAGTVTWSDNSTGTSLTLSAVGTYSITATCTVSGCQSPASSAVSGLEIKAKPLPPTITLTSASSVCTPSTLNLTASGCAGTVTWSQGAATGTSLTLSAVGTYSITATCTINGCTSDASSAVSGLEIKQTPAAPTITPPAQLVVCSPSTLTLTASGCAGTVTWSDNSTGTSLTLSAVGTYSITATCTVSGCQSPASTAVSGLEIKAKPLPPTITLTSASSVCTPSTLNLTASGCAGTVTWSQGAATGTSLTLSAVGTYSITATCTINGCTSDASSAVTGLEIKQTPTAPTITPPAQLVVCSPSTLTLTASGCAGTVTWSQGGATGTSLTLSAVGTYSITATCTINGCPSGASSAVSGLEIKAKPSPPTIVLTSASSVCTPATLNLTASGCAGTATWSQGVATGTSLTLSTVGTYSITATCTVNGCTSDPSTAVSGLEIKQTPAAPTIGATTASAVCSPSTINLTASGCAGTITWSQGAATGTSLTLSAIGTYSITATCTVNGCPSPASTAVSGLEIKALPIATASNNGPYLFGQTISLSASGGTIYSWSGPNSFSSTSATPTINNAQPPLGGTYTVTVTNVGCSATATTNVVVSGVDPCVQILAYDYVLAGNPSQYLLNLTNGQNIAQRPTATSIVVRPICNTVTIGSVEMTITGPGLNWTTLQNVEPYALFDNTGNNIYGQVLAPGTYSLTTTGYFGVNRTGGTTYGPIVTNFTIIGNAPTISTPTFTGTEFCAGATVNVSFTTTGTFAGGNLFQVLLSDPNGSFTNPQIIGTSTVAGSVLCTIPPLAIGGESYRIKVISTDPAASGNYSLLPLTVNPLIYNLVSPTNDYPFGTATKKAIQTINARNNITGASRINYKAGNAINLTPGFQVVSHPGSSFKAQIEGCSN